MSKLGLTTESPVVGNQKIGKTSSYFEYITGLDGAISDVCRDLLEKGHALSVGGLDVSEAYKRLLYFLHRDSGEFYQIFTQQTDPQKPSLFRSEIERSLAIRLAPAESILGGVVKSGFLERLKTLRLQFSNRSPWRESSSDNRVDFLFVPSRDKFLPVMRPICERLGNRAAVLATPPLSGNLEGLRFVPPARGCVFRSDRAWAHDLRGFRILNSLTANLLASIKKYRPMCLVVCEGNSPGDAVVGSIGRSLGIPVCCIQHGWSPFLHVGFRNMPFDRFFVWGNRFRQILATENDEQIFAMTGAHQLSAVSDRHRDQAKKCVGVLLQNSPRGERRFGLIDPGSWSKSLSIIKEIALRFPEIQFRIRTHPNSSHLDLESLNLSMLKNVCLFRPSEETISQFFSSVDMSVSIYSTTLYESVYAGVLPVILHIASIPSLQPDLEQAGLAISATNSEELGDRISRFYSDAEWRCLRLGAMDKSASEYFYAVGELALSNIVSELLRCGE